MRGGERGAAGGDVDGDGDPDLAFWGVDLINDGPVTITMDTRNKE